MPALNDLIADEAARNHHFPVTAGRLFYAHAGVSALPRAALESMEACMKAGSEDAQDNEWDAQKVRQARQAAARLLNCSASEIALLGPTSLGISLVAHGLEWAPGDEVVFYPDDYPSNVYPWKELERQGVKPVPLRPERQGVITWETVEEALSERTRLVALASCNFLSGYRLDLDAIGRRLRERGVLFSVDGIQTLGAFPTTVEHVDFLSADSHKWLLGPCGAGVFYVRRDIQEQLRPTLLGAWNVVSPEFIAQDCIEFHSGARRYEPGSLNLPGIIGMLGAMEMILEAGVEAISERILAWRETFLEAVRPMGYRLCLEDVDQDPATPPSARTGIISITHGKGNVEPTFQWLKEHNVRLSLRRDRSGNKFLRFSPHFYNTFDELDRIVDLLRDAP